MYLNIYRHVFYRRYNCRMFKGNKTTFEFEANPKSQKFPIMAAHKNAWTRTFLSHVDIDIYL